MGHRHHCCCNPCCNSCCRTNDCGGGFGGGCGFGSSSLILLALLFGCRF